MARNKGMSLMELLVYLAIAVVLLVAAYMMLSFARSTATQASSGFAMGQDTAMALARLRQDLQESSLQSLRFFRTQERAQISMVSARDGTGQFQITPYGVPNWSGRVCYELGAADASGLAPLIRAEVTATFPNRCPLPAQALLDLTGSRQQVVVPSVLAPDYEVVLGANGSASCQPSSSSGRRGGLNLDYLRHDPGQAELTRSPLNPNQSDDSQQPGWSAGCTELVEAHVVVAELTSSTGKWNLVDVAIVAAPRH